MEVETSIWVALVVCLALSFLLSGMEAGVFALSRLQIRQQMRAGRRSATTLHGYLENPENFLWTILVGNTLANFIVLGSLITVLYETLQGHPLWFVACFLAVVFLFYALCDLLPKMIFRAQPNRFCLALARPFRYVHLGLWPLVWMVERISATLLYWTGGKAFTGHLFGNREELRFVMQESARSFSTEERAMINRVMDLPSLTVRQIARPLDQVVSVEIQATVSESLALCRERQFTRLPVWEKREGRHRVVGLVSVDALLYQPALDGSKPLGEFVRPALYLDEDQRLEDALRRMQRSGQRLAIVLGRDQREIGIISLEDVLKAVLGEARL